MRVYGSLLLAGLLMLAASSAVMADGGLINPVHPDIDIYEPGQKAIVAWNGEQEVLILSIDVWAQENNWALELVPLPSLPTVEAGDFGSFYKVNNLLSSYMDSKWRLDMGGLGTYGGKAGESFDVLFQENIGAHYITVAWTTSAQGLIAFAENLWMTNLGPAEFSWERLEDLAASYIERGIRYWAIDLLDLSDYMKSREPLVYTFNTDYLYFPLEISSVASGDTRITLYTITPENTDDYPTVEMAELSKGSFWVGWEEENHENFPIEFVVSQNELQQISPKVAELFENGAWLTAWHYYGGLDELKGDFVISTSAAPSPGVQPVGGIDQLLVVALVVAIVILELEIFVLVYKRKPKI